MSNETVLTIVGWVGAPPELRTTASGQRVANFRMASTARRFRDGAWADAETTWHSITAWGRLAEHVSRSVSTGDPVVVQGRLTSDVWQREDGTTSTKLIVTATHVGHDLTYGTSSFERAPSPTAASPSAPAPASEGAQAALPDEAKAA